jgi:hypothetical protein
MDMIGELIGEMTGKVVSCRVVKHAGREPMLERTIMEKGKIFGTEVSFIATSWSKDRPQGGSFTRGHGIMTTNKGEKARLHGSGISIPGKSTGMSLRGIRFLQTTSPSLSRLNDVALAFEIEITPDGAVHDKMWEWK